MFHPHLKALTGYQWQQVFYSLPGCAFRFDAHGQNEQFLPEFSASSSYLTAHKIELLRNEKKHYTSAACPGNANVLNEQVMSMELSLVVRVQEMHVNGSENESENESDNESDAESDDSVETTYVKKLYRGEMGVKDDSEEKKEEEMEEEQEEEEKEEEKGEEQEEEDSGSYVALVQTQKRNSSTYPGITIFPIYPVYGCMVGTKIFNAAVNFNRNSTVAKVAAKRLHFLQKLDTMLGFEGNENKSFLHFVNSLQLYCPNIHATKPVNKYWAPKGSHSDGKDPLMIESQRILQR